MKFLPLHLVAFIAACALGGCGARSSSAPPNITLDSLDPSLAQLVGTARGVVIASPQSAEAWGKLGQALHAAEFFNEAQPCYQRAAELDPSSPRWPHLLALLQLQEQPAEAVRNLTRAAGLADARPDAPRVRLVQALVERGRYAEADGPLRALLARDPAHAAARLEAARVHLARGELDRVADALQPCLTNAFTARPALLLLAQARQRSGDSAGAADASRRAFAMPRSFDWPDPFLREVQNLRADRQKSADQINALLMQQKFKEAEAVLARLLKDVPDDAEGLLLLGRLRYQGKKCAEAEAALRRHLVAQPQSLNGLMQLSLALLCQQRWPDAITTLREALALKPDFAQAHNNLGYALSRSGDAAGAIQSYREALRASPGDIGTHLALAEELFQAGQREEAAIHLERSMSINPNDPRIKQLRARLQP